MRSAPTLDLEPQRRNLRLSCRDDRRLRVQPFKDHRQLRRGHHQPLCQALPFEFFAVSVGYAPAVRQEEEMHPLVIDELAHHFVF